MKFLPAVLFCVVLLLSGSSKATSEVLQPSDFKISQGQESLAFYPGPLLIIKEKIVYDSEKRGNPCDIVWRIPFFLLSPVDMMVARVCLYLYPNQRRRNDSGLTIKGEDIALDEYLKNGRYNSNFVKNGVESDLDHFRNNQNSDLFEVLIVRRYRRLDIRFSLLGLEIIQ